MLSPGAKHLRIVKRKEKVPVLVLVKTELFAAVWKCGSIRRTWING